MVSGIPLIIIPTWCVTKLLVPTKNDVSVTGTSRDPHGQKSANADDIVVVVVVILDFVFQLDLYNQITYERYCPLMASYVDDWIYQSPIVIVLLINSMFLVKIMRVSGVRILMWPDVNELKAKISIGSHCLTRINASELCLSISDDTGNVSYYVVRQRKR